VLSAVHPRHGIPHRSLVALGLVASAFCFFSLQQVITMLVITRILLQFFLQQIGVMLLRVQRPELPRPFRIPLYPLPPLAAMAGFLFILVYRRTGGRRGHWYLRHADLSHPREATSPMAVYARSLNRTIG
jgi:amino acid transporter